MKRLFFLAILTVSVALGAAFPAITATAASGSIGVVCLTGNNLTVVLNVSGPSTDYVGISVNGGAIIFSQVGSGTLVFNTVVLSPTGILIQAGNTDSGGKAFGAGLSGSGQTYNPPNCGSISGGGVPTGLGFGGSSGIPPGFVIRGIRCTVAVFSQVDGTPVGSNVLLKGQNWYVNPAPVRGKFRRFWTEVYVSGPVNGYVPTRCILPYAFP